MSGLPWPSAFVGKMLAEMRTFEGEAMRPALVHGVGVAARTVLDIHRRYGELSDEAKVTVGEVRGENGSIRAIHVVLSEPWRDPLTFTLGPGEAPPALRRLEELRGRSLDRRRAEQSEAEADRLRAALEHEAKLAFKQWEMLERRAGVRSPYAREAWRRWARIEAAFSGATPVEGADDGEIAP